MNTLYSILLFACILTLSSCTKIIAHVIIKNPKTSTIEQQKGYWNKQGKSEQPYYYLAISANEYSDSLYEQVDVTGPLIFNQDGYKLLYKGNEKCGGNIMETFLAGDLSEFEIDSTKNSFEFYAQRIKDDNGQLINPKIVTEKSYTIVNSWNRYLAPKYWFRDQINWIDSQIVEQKLDRIQFLKVNNDFLVENGFKKGKKAKLKRYIDEDRRLQLNLVRPPKSK